MPLPGYGKKLAKEISEGLNTDVPKKVVERKVGQNGKSLITIDDMFVEINSRLANIEQMLSDKVWIASPSHAVQVKEVVLQQVEPKSTPWIEVPSAADVILAAKDFHTKNGTEALKLQLNTFFVHKVSELKEEDYAAFLGNLKK